MPDSTHLQQLWPIGLGHRQLSYISRLDWFAPDMFPCTIIVIVFFEIPPSPFLRDSNCLLWLEITGVEVSMLHIPNGRLFVACHCTHQRMILLARMKFADMLTHDKYRLDTDTGCTS